MPGFDNVDFAVFAVEAYRRAKGLSGAQVADLFALTGIFDFLEEFGDTLHCQDEKETVAEIDEMISRSSHQTGKMFEECVGPRC